MHQYYDAVILSVGNGLLKRFFKQNAQLNIASRPLIITLFPGVVFGDQASILSRMGADIVYIIISMILELQRNIRNNIN